MENLNTLEKLKKATARVILQSPFFATLLLGMRQVEDSSVKTLSTDGLSVIKYNPKFIDSLNLSEAVFTLCHEVLHGVFHHSTRRGNRSANRWNQAADYIVNDVLVREKIGTPIRGALISAKLVADGKNTTEGVYKLLPADADDKGTGEEGGAMDDIEEAAEDEATASQKESESRVKVAQARNAAKSAGQLSEGIERLVKNLNRAKVDWKSVLRRFMTERAKTELSYAKPKRRFLGEDIYLPSPMGERHGFLAVAVDCSGSVDSDLLNAFAAEIQGICEDIKPELVRVVYFDSKVLHVQDFKPEDTVKLQAYGGGGTKFSPIFSYLNAQELQPVACVVLTDLDCGDFGPMPDYPVLWSTTRRESTPWGEVLKMEL